MAQNTRKMWVEDADHMEEAMSRLAGKQDIWQNQIIYWICVAVYHLVQRELRRETKS